MANTELVIDRLEMLKRRVPKEKDEELLNDFLLEAESIIKERRALGVDDDFPNEYAITAVSIAEYLYARRGSIGETIHIENNVNRHYGDGYVPESMLRNVIPLVKIYK